MNDGVHTYAPTALPGAPDAADAFWTRERVAAALGSGPSGPETFARVWTDTRSVQPGDCFVALAGEHFDAHEFLAQAVEKGAHAVVVSRPERAAGLGVPVYVVPDTLVALGGLARFRRRAWARPVVGVIGSTGKTSTKELLRAALGARLRVHATTGNLNNLVGVPLTLLALPDDADIAVVEMGTNQPGEVSRLRAIVEPDLVVVTSITEEHLEGLGDLEGVLREEMGGVTGVPVVITPASQPEVAESARASGAGRVVSAGLDAGDVRPDRWSVGPDGVGTLSLGGLELRPPVRGAHNLRNAMLALAVAAECGVAREDAVRGIEGMPVPPMRTSFQQLGTLTVINDAYNANPGSVRAALELLQHAGAGRQRVAVLGSMLELGGHADRLHAEILDEVLASPVELLAATGDFARAARARLSREGSDESLAGRVVHAEDAEAIWPHLRPRLAPDALVLLKGSRGVRLERILPMLAELAGVELSGDSASH